eukprot:symbB.v1.2.013707.t1/scaffold974.1/size359025/14
MAKWATRVALEELPEVIGEVHEGHEGDIQRPDLEDSVDAASEMADTTVLPASSTGPDGPLPENIQPPAAVSATTAAAAAKMADDIVKPLDAADEPTEQTDESCKDETSGSIYPQFYARIRPSAETEASQEHEQSSEALPAAGDSIDRRLPGPGSLDGCGRGLPLCCRRTAGALRDSEEAMGIAGTGARASAAPWKQQGNLPCLQQQDLQQCSGRQPWLELQRSSRGFQAFP